VGAALLVAVEVAAGGGRRREVGLVVEEGLLVEPVPLVDGVNARARGVRGVDGLDEPVELVVVEEPLRFLAKLGVLEALEDAPVALVVGVGQDVGVPVVGAVAVLARDGDEVVAAVVGIRPRVVVSGRPR
jgi:hypothetical protein